MSGSQLLFEKPSASARAYTDAAAPAPVEIRTGLTRDAVGVVARQAEKHRSVAISDSEERVVLPRPADEMPAG